jgi:hypothetical protein
VVQARFALFLLFFFELGILFGGLLIETFQLLSGLFIYFFHKLEDGLLVILEEVFRLGQIATQQHGLFGVKDNGNEFDIRISVYLYKIVRVEF